jgi:hypothetical protein
MQRVIWLSLGLLAGCALDNDYSKVSQTAHDCGRVTAIGPYTSEACLTCLQTRCCDEVGDCMGDDACKAVLSSPLSPASDAPESADVALGCMQRSCDAECNVSFGCEGTGYADNSRNPGGKVTARLQLMDFIASSTPVLSPINMQGCATLTSPCERLNEGAEFATSSPDGAISVSSARPEALLYLTEDPGYDAATANRDDPHYPPHAFAWAEPVPSLGPVVEEQMFSAIGVNTLTFIAAGAAYSPSDSHVVFYLHNCVPLPYLPRSRGPLAPWAGIPDAQITLVQPDGETVTDDRIVYRNERDYSTGSSSEFGSGGVAQVPSGRWKNASATVTAPDGSEHTLETGAFMVPEGGVGVVHLFPASTVRR